MQCCVLALYQPFHSFGVIASQRRRNKNYMSLLYRVCFFFVRCPSITYKQTRRQNRHQLLTQECRNQFCANFFFSCRCQLVGSTLFTLFFFATMTGSSSQERTEEAPKVDPRVHASASIRRHFFFFWASTRHVDLSLLSTERKRNQSATRLGINNSPHSSESSMYGSSRQQAAVLLAPFDTLPTALILFHSHHQ